MKSENSPIATPSSIMSTGGQRRGGDLPENAGRFIKKYHTAVVTVTKDQMEQLK
jgi:hypothetical protein